MPPKKFDKEPIVNRTPTDIPTIEVTLLDEGGLIQVAARIQIDDADGEVMNWRNVDLEDHFNVGQIQRFNVLMGELRAQVAQEILP